MPAPAALDPGRLFGRFYRADDARGAAGSGLGLAVSASLAAAMSMRLSARLEGDVLVVELRLPEGCAVPR